MADKNPVTAELQQFMHDMSEAVLMLDTTDRTRELVKAGMRTCMGHAITQYMRRNAGQNVPLPPEQHT
jgi:hypothetical protein